MFDDLITLREVSGDRAAKCTGGIERVMTEGAVMLAFATHLFELEPQLRHVAIHPDGEHGKIFEIRRWLEGRGFAFRKGIGKTDFGGLYASGDGREILVNPKSGVGDVIADIEGRSYLAECKGGVINTKHPGLNSRLRSGFCETVGLLLATPRPAGQRQYAVVPFTPTTASLAAKLRPRAADVGIEIVLLDEHGKVAK